jgi:hypothetical protein
MKNKDYKLLKSLFVLGILFSLSTINSSAQSTETSPKTDKELKNTIRFNITNPLFLEVNLLFLDTKDN